jgi:Holliday junction resolvase-like predicted endonuclease
MRRIRQAAMSWLAANPLHGGCDVRFDVVVERAGKLERLAEAF